MRVPRVMGAFIVSRQIEPSTVTDPAADGTTPQVNVVPAATPRRVTEMSTDDPAVIVTVFGDTVILGTTVAGAAGSARSDRQAAITAHNAPSNRTIREFIWRSASAAFIASSSN